MQKLFSVKKVICIEKSYLKLFNKYFNMNFNCTLKLLYSYLKHFLIVFNRY